MTAERREVNKTSYPQWADLPVKFNVHASDDYIVFLDPEDEVDWRTSARYDREQRFPDGWGHVQNRFASLEGTIAAGVPEAHQKVFRRMLAEGVARALEGEVKEANEILDQAEAFCLARNRERGRLTHIRVATITAVITATLCVLLWLVRARLENVFGSTALVLSLCAAAGAGGGWFWIMTNTKGAPDPRAIYALQVAEAVVRVLIGALGAVVAVLGLKSGLLSPQLRSLLETTPGLVLLSFVAGASERLVPDLIRRLDTPPADPPKALPPPPAGPPAKEVGLGSVTPPVIVPSVPERAAASPPSSSRP